MLKVFFSIEFESIITGQARRLILNGWERVQMIISTWVVNVDYFYLKIIFQGWNIREMWVTNMFLILHMIFSRSVPICERRVVFSCAKQVVSENVVIRYNVR